MLKNSINGYIKSTSIIKREIYINGKHEGDLLFVNGKVGSMCVYENNKLAYQYFPNGNMQYFKEDGSSEIVKATKEIQKKYQWAFERLVNYNKLPSGTIEWKDFGGAVSTMPILSGKQDENGNIEEKNHNDTVLGKGKKLGNKRKWQQRCYYIGDRIYGHADGKEWILASHYHLIRRSKANDNNVVYASVYNNYQKNKKIYFDEVEVSPEGLVVREDKGYEKPKLVGVKVVPDAKNVVDIMVDGTAVYSDGSKSKLTENGLDIITDSGVRVKYDMLHNTLTYLSEPGFTLQQTEQGFYVEENEYHSDPRGNHMGVDVSLQKNYTKNGEILTIKGTIIEDNGGYWAGEGNFNSAPVDENGQYSYNHRVYNFEYSTETGYLSTQCVRDYYDHAGPTWEAPKDQQPDIYYAGKDGLSLQNVIHPWSMSGGCLPPIRLSSNNGDVYTYKYKDEPKINGEMREYKNGEPFNGEFETLNEAYGITTKYKVKNGQRVEGSKTFWNGEEDITSQLVYQKTNQTRR